MFNEYRVSVLQDEKSSGDGWLHSNVVYVMPLNCTRQSDEDGQFYVIQHKKGRQITKNL